MTNFIFLWKPIVEISILWFIFYHVMLFFEGTPAAQVLRGIGLLLISFFLFQKLGLEKLGLDVLDWLLTELLGISVITILIIFHPEIRQGLARIGRKRIFLTTLKEEEIDSILKEIGRAIENLSKRKIGALIAVEKNESLRTYIERGALIDACISSDLIETIFTPNNPLHDGGLIIQNGRLTAAGCLFPLTQNQHLSRMFGTRHRAALGLSEETDAIIIVVSEERQNISLVYQGKLNKDLSREDLFFKIKDILKTG